MDEREVALRCQRALLTRRLPLQPQGHEQAAPLPRRSLRRHPPGGHLQSPPVPLDAYREVWIVVDHDGQDRRPFLAACRKLSSEQTVVHGVVSVPCFEVWLNAHYAPVQNYQSQADAQEHYLKLTGLSKKNAKTLPGSFPWDAAAQAVDRCHLPTDEQPEIDAQGTCPSTTMPHLLRSLGLLNDA